MLDPARRRTEDPAPLAVAYARVSTSEQAEGGMSLDAQLGAIRSHARQRGLTLVHEYVERGATGTDDGRPEFQRMIESLFAPSNTVTTVLVLHTSRFMRDVELARRYKRELRRKGVRVVAVQQEVGDDPNGELMEGVYELFDQHESRIIGVRARAAMNENARAGFFNGASPPFGFAIEHVTGPGGRAKRRLVPDTEEARVVKLIFEGYVGGAGAKALAKQLNGEGLRYRGRLWSRDHVLGVLGDRTAIGDYRWGQREARTGKKRDARDQVRVELPPIVDVALFDAAERAREARDPKEPDARHGRPPTLLLGGLLRCTRCGGRFQLETSGKRDPKGKPTYRYYNCSTTCRTGQDACPGYRISAETLERAVLRFIAEELFTPERCRGFLHDVLAGQDAARTASAARRRELEAKLADLNARIARWTDAFESGGDLADLGVDRFRELRARREEAERALHAEAATVSAPPPYLYKEETLARFTARLRTAFDNPAGDLARAYVERLIERIDLADGDVTVYGNAADVVATMAEKGSIAPARNRRSKVRTYVVGWRANWVPSMNVRSGFLIDLGRERKRRQSASLEPPRVSHLLAKAEQWQAEIDRGEVRNLTALARREGLSHVYVSHLLDLLRLHPDIRAAIAALPAGTSRLVISERRLRPFTKQSWDRQLKELAWLIQRSRTA